MSEVTTLRKVEACRKYALLMTTALATSLITINIGNAQVVDQTAQVQQQNLRFQIAPQSLADGVLLFGQQANVEILADSTVLVNIRTRGVHGVMTLERGLMNLLEGTGLNYQLSGDHTVTIGSFDTDTSEEQSELAPIVIEAESDDTLIQDGYVPLVSQIGTKKDTPLIEVPQNISVVTERQLDDRAPRTLNETLAYTTGVNNSSFGFDPRYDAFFVRGFAGVYNGVFRDGVRQFAGSSAIYRTEPYGVEGVEILKGPSSTLYGASSSGGFVNLVTKRPTKERLREIEVIAGNNKRYQGNFDFSDSLDEEGTIKYRLTGVARDSETHLRGFDDDKLYLAPVVEWRPNEDTKLTVLTEYSDMTTGGTAFFYHDGNGLTDIYAGDEDWNDFDQEQYRLGYEFEHRFNDTFTVRQNVRYADVDIDLQFANVSNAQSLNNLLPDVLFRTYGQTYEDQQTFVIDNNLVTSVETGPIGHTVVSGFDYGYSDFNQRRGVGNSGDSIIYSGGLTIPISAPPFGIPVSEAQLLTLNQIGSLKQKQHQFGVYLHDTMELGPWRLALGARHDWLDSETETTRIAGTINQDASEYSYQLGLAYVTDFGLVPFANYSTSFTPNVGDLVDGTPAKPTIGKQVEAGLKYEFLNHNAMVQASVFNIDQKDGVVFDSSGGPNVQVQQDMVSRGLELEAVASLTEGLSLTAGYAYTDVEIESGPTGTDGKQLSGTPEHTFSTYLDYEFQEGALKGLGLSSGFRYFGKSYGNDTNTLKNNERYFVDTALRYDLGQVSHQLEGAEFKVNANNLFDQTKTICKSGSCYRDEGRTVQASLRYRF